MLLNKDIFVVQNEHYFYINSKSKPEISQLHNNENNYYKTNSNDNLHEFDQKK